MLGSFFKSKVFIYFFVLITALSMGQLALAQSSFERNLSLGSRGQDVLALQKILNTDPDTRIADSGPGSPGEETSYFGNLTRQAVVKLQDKYSEEILKPVGLSNGTGFVGPSTRAKINTLIVGSSGGSENPTSATGTEQKTPVTINSFSPTSGPAGTVVTINGSGFSETGNTIYTDYATTNNVTSSDGKTITFTIPEPVFEFQLSVNPNDPPIQKDVSKMKHKPALQYWIYVKNADGQTNHFPSQPFVVTSY